MNSQRAKKNRLNSRPESSNGALGAHTIAVRREFWNTPAPITTCVPSSSTVATSSSVPTSSTVPASSSFRTSATVPSSSSSSFRTSATVPASSSFRTSTTVPVSSSFPTSATVPASSSFRTSATVPASSSFRTSATVPASSSFRTSSNVPALFNDRTSSTVPASRSVPASSTASTWSSVPSAIVSNPRPTRPAIPASVARPAPKPWSPSRSSNGPLTTINQNKPMSVVDPAWELIDPNPDIYGLFALFNATYFWDKLGTVTVDWSSKMTTCAGLCYFKGVGNRSEIRIKLSLPLLKLRPRKDLVETLLHEMIHAYLFLEPSGRQNHDRDGHGPNFQEHMHRINGISGSHITIYHSFHDEVGHYKQHWWQCNGPCRNRHPYYGKVKRAMNRAPGPSDRWWSEHAANCDGVFIKVKEPPKVDKAQKKRKEPPTSTSTSAF